MGEVVSIDPYRAGEQVCPHCGKDVVRARTAGTAHLERTVPLAMFQADPQGRWYHDPVRGLMRYGAVSGNLDRYARHSCSRATL